MSSYSQDGKNLKYLSAIVTEKKHNILVIEAEGETGVTGIERECCRMATWQREYKTNLAIHVSWLIVTDISEELAASIFRMQKVSA